MVRRNLAWSVIGPVALVAVALAGIAWFDVREGGSAKPKPFLGEIGTPVRMAYLAPTATPIGAPTARPKPTFTAGSSLPKGTAPERDARRRSDLLRLLQAATDYKAAKGVYPDTKNNVQTICVYKNLDTGCKLGETFSGELPEDPLGNQNGYWIQSTETAIKLFAALEGSVDAALKCPTSDKELSKRENLVCVTGP